MPSVVTGIQETVILVVVLTYLIYRSLYRSLFYHFGFPNPSVMKVNFIGISIFDQLLMLYWIALSSH